MSDHLCFTPAEYAAILRASGRILLAGPFTAFQRRLADALLRTHPALAARIASLHVRQVRTLRFHLERRGREDLGNTPATGASEQARCDLSFQECQAVARACSLITLRDGCLPDCKVGFLREVAETEPDLAAKLVWLNEGQVATLCRRVKAGKRWCP